MELDPAQTATLDQMVARFLEAITTLDVHDEAFATKVRDIQKLGDDDIRASAAVSNRLLDKPMAAMANGGVSEASEVSKSLLSLRRTVEDLDPAKQGDLFSPKRLLGVIPFGDKLRRLLPQVPVQPGPPQRDHHEPVRRPGRAAPRQRRASSRRRPTSGR